MASRIDDRWLWLGFGVFFFVAAHGIRYAITDIVSLTEVETSQDVDNSQEQPEDSISVETLKTLSESPNRNIANSAITLIVGRFAQMPDAHEILAKDCYSNDEPTRRKARTALKFLKDYPFPGLSAGQHVPMPLRNPSRVRTPDPLPQTVEEWGDYFRSMPDAHGATLDMLDRLHDDADTIVPSEARPVAGWTSIPRARPLSSTEIDSEARRRRREAMVFHEGEGGVREGDIIRPQRLR